MAVYKVPQDVEAEDKLIGPFSFRQFIYLLIAAMAIALAWGLSRLFVPLSIIPLPVVILFGALALPLRKDQPMEIYLAALVSFYMKPRRRLWDPDGTESLVEITAPKTVEAKLTKEISKTEAQRRLSYLADIVDSRGWSIRGVGMQATNSALNSDIYFEAQQVEDILDNNTSTSQNFSSKLVASDNRRHQEAINMMHEKVLAPPPVVTPTTPQPVVTIPQTPVMQPAPEPAIAPKLEFNPYPDEIHQTVIQPINPTDRVEDETPPTTSEKSPSADIINLASNTDLSVETIAREANRINKKQGLDEEEVIISLR